MNFLIIANKFKMKTEDSDPVFQLNETVLLTSSPWQLIKNPLLRLLCHLHLSTQLNRVVSIPFKSFWFRFIFKCWFKNNDQVCVMINAHNIALLNSQTISFLRKKYVKCKVVLSFSDKFEFFTRKYKSFPSIEWMKNSFDVIFTYNEEDIRSFGFCRSPILVRSFSEVEDDESIPRSDVFFVGRAKDRLFKIHDIYKRCITAGLTCDFYITDVPAEDMFYSGSITYNHFMNYSEVLKHVKRSNCVLNVVQDGGQGITRRDCEAFGMGKLLLTDNSFIKETELYKKEQVIFLEELENRIDEIKNGFSGSCDWADRFSLKNHYASFQRIIEMETKKKQC